MIFVFFQITFSLDLAGMGKGMGGGGLMSGFNQMGSMMSSMMGSLGNLGGGGSKGGC